MTGAGTDLLDAQSTTTRQPVLVGIPRHVVVCMAGWHVDDGHPEVRVGGVPWTPVIEVARAGPTEPDDWWPEVAPVEDARPPQVTQRDILDGAPVYQFVADVAAVDRFTGWTGLRAGPYAFGVPGVHEGRVEGIGIFVYDTYIVEGEHVLAALRAPLKVVRIQRLRRQAQPHKTGTVFPAAIGPPSDVPGTRHERPAERPGEIVTFLIHSAPTSGGPSQVQAP